jgi:hypothetical protein
VYNHVWSSVDILHSRFLVAALPLRHRSRVLAVAVSLQSTHFLCLHCIWSSIVCLAFDLRGAGNPFRDPVVAAVLGMLCDFWNWSCGWFADFLCCSHSPIESSADDMCGSRAKWLGSRIAHKFFASPVPCPQKQHRSVHSQSCPSAWMESGNWLCSSSETKEPPVPSRKTDGISWCQSSGRQILD